VIASLDLRDDRLAADRTEQLLQQRYRTSYGLECKPEDEDVTLELGDVDYLCAPNDRSQFAYWVGTDENRITLVALAVAPTAQVLHSHNCRRAGLCPVRPVRPIVRS
jgi:hypothetical protein